MEFFDYFIRMFGMDPTQMPVYGRIMTVIVPIAFVFSLIYGIAKKAQNVVKTIRHMRQGIRVKENPSLGADEVRAIAVGALYAYQQGGYVDDMELNVDESRLTTLLSEWWGIDNRDDAIDTVNYLSNYPSQSILPLVCAAYNAPNKDEAMRIIRDEIANEPNFASLHDGMEQAEELIKTAQKYLSNLKSEYEILVNHKIISSVDDVARLGVVAWDAGRLNFVARAALQKGYFTHEECQDCIDRAYAMAKSAGFESWKDFANSYMLGRTMWNGDCNMTSLAEDLLTQPNSPWVRFPWEADK